LHAEVDFDPHRAVTIDQPIDALIEKGMRPADVVNSLGRAQGGG
jgi:hypothetical protein